ncbi:hypothetical protein [Christiangramia aestuarii]|uniref:Uncharacterized protein n=1 Tax=Christiangramia aestuarii TaxID=1028746 RepID=A0A7K1LQN7_9FLAO|nr:hypothetical protein [Christiangramia aestuarii]MUP43122.1 hypothetical protein [Christiangramia aestuarii]
MTISILVCFIWGPHAFGVAGLSALRGSLPQSLAQVLYFPSSCLDASGVSGFHKREAETSSA